MRLGDVSLSVAPENSCPACGYACTRALGAHRCSECGFQLEAGATCFRPRGYLRADSWHATLWGVVVVMWITPFAMRQFPLWFQVWWLVVASVMLYGVVSFVLRRLKYPHPMEFLFIGSTRVSVRIRGQPDWSIEWANVQRISVSHFFAQVRVHERARGRVYRIPGFFRPKGVTWEEFARLFGQAWRLNVNVEGHDAKNLCG